MADIATEQIVETPVIAETTPVAQAGAKQNPATTPERSVATEAKPEPPASAPKGINIDDLTDEEVNALIEKKTKGKYKSLDELDAPAPKSKEQLEKEATKRKTDALNWAFENGKTTKKDYDDAIVRKSKSNRELALSIFTSNLQEEDKDITAEEAEEIFKDAYHENLEDTTRLFKVGQKEIDKLANSYRKEKDSAIDNIEPEYDAFEQTQEQYKVYKTNIKKIAADLPKEISLKVPYKYLDGEASDIDFKVVVDEKTLTKLLSDYTDKKQFVLRNVATDGKIDEKELTKELTYHLEALMLKQSLPAMLESFAKEVETRMEVVLGNKGIDRKNLANGQQQQIASSGKVNDYSQLETQMKKQGIL